MRVCALFYINGYAAPDYDAPEKFASLADCKAAFAAEVSEAQGYGAGYDNDDDGGGCAWVFIGHEAGDYPDYVLTIGARGAVNCARG